MVLICKSLSLLHLRMLCAKFGWNWQKLLGSKILIIISPWKMVWPFIWTNLNPLHLRMLCVKFGCNRPSGSGEDFVNVFSLFCNYLSLDTGGPFIWTNLNSLYPRMLCAKLKLAKWFLRRRWKCNKFMERQTDRLYKKLFKIHYYLLLEKGMAILWRNMNSLHPWCFVPGLVKINPVAQEKRIFKYVT